MIGRYNPSEVEPRFKKLGFDRVYPPEQDIDSAIVDLKNDLKVKGRM